MASTYVEGFTWLPFFKNIFIEISLLNSFFTSLLKKGYARWLIVEFKTNTGILYFTSLHDAIPVVSNSIRKLQCKYIL